MVVYNLYLVLNNELIEIYDEKTREVRFEGLSNNIPDNLMDRYVNNLSIKRMDAHKRLLIVID